MLTEVDADRKMFAKFRNENTKLKKEWYEITEKLEATKGKLESQIKETSSL